MKDYTPSDPVFSDTIQVIETTDPVHADAANAAPKQIHQNTLVNHARLTALEKITAELDSSDNGLNIIIEED